MNILEELESIIFNTEDLPIPPSMLLGIPIVNTKEYLIDLYNQMSDVKHKGRIEEIVLAMRKDMGGMRFIPPKCECEENATKIIKFIKEASNV